MTAPIQSPAPNLRPLRVLLLARYGMTGASSRVRYYSYIEPLARHRISVEVDYLIDDASIARFYAGRVRRWDHRHARSG